MSDNKKQTETPVPEQAKSEPVAVAPPVATQARPGRGAIVLALLALLLAVAAAGVSGWLYYQTLQPVQVDDHAMLRSQLQELREQLGQSADLLEQVGDGALDMVRIELSEQARASADEIDLLRRMLDQQRLRMAEMGNTDRSDWKLAEVEYLLRLANQRLLMAGDPESAEALLSNADGIVRDLDDPGLYALRAALANDLAAIRAVPELDLEGTWLRIQALVGQVDALVLFELPELHLESMAPAPDSGWRQRVSEGVSAAIARLGSYIQIKRRDTPYEALLDPQWEGLVRQNMRMLLEQSRAALLSGNQVLYQQSLSNARHWIAEFFSVNEAAVAAVDLELLALSEVVVERELPTVNAALKAARDAQALRRPQNAVTPAPVVEAQTAPLTETGDAQ